MNRTLRRGFRFMGWFALMGLVVCGVLVIGAIGMASWIADGTSIHLDGESLGLTQFDIGDAVGAAIGIVCALVGVAVATVVVLLVVPLAVLLPLLLVALVVGGVLVVIAGVVTVAFSPLLLLIGTAWLAWRLMRRGTRSTAPAMPAPGMAGATIPR